MLFIVLCFVFLQECVSKCMRCVEQRRLLSLQVFRGLYSSLLVILVFVMRIGVVLLVFD